MAEAEAKSNVETAKQLYESLGRGDMDAVLNGLHPDVVWTETEGSPTGGTYHGPEAVAENVFGYFGEHLDELVVTPNQYVGDRDTVVVLGGYRLTGPGGTVECPFAHVWTFEDGKASSFTQYADSGVLNRAF